MCKNQVSFDGKVFCSRADVARYLGVTPAAIYRAVKTGRDLRSVGKNPKSGQFARGHQGYKCKPVNIHGVQYPSIKAAASHLGVSMERVRTAMRSGKTSRLPVGKPSH